MLKSNGIPLNMGLDHVGIVVPNAKLAADFLMEVFDADFDWEVKRDAKPSAGERGWSKTFGVDNDAYLAHVIMLKCGTHPLTQNIELFEWHTPNQIQLEGELGWHRFSDIGNSYISFTVKDIHLVMEHIKCKVIPKWKNVRFIQDPPMEFPLPGEVCTSTFLVSPWGMWIELTCWSESKKHGVLLKKQQDKETNTYVGRSITNIPTPALLVDLDAIDHNIELMGRRILGNGFDWKIPCKAHKCPGLAKYILQKSNATGIVVLTVNEAKRFAAAGLNNIYLANQIALEDMQRLSLIAKQTNLTIAVDNINYLKQVIHALEQWEIPSKINILIELNINHNRCGVDNIEEAVLLAEFAHHVQHCNGPILFKGITGYEGHTPILAPVEKSFETQRAHKILDEAKFAIEARNINVATVSAGGSCNYIDCIRTNVLTEIQAGGGILCDLLYYEKANLKDHGHKIGAFIQTEIISVPSHQKRAMANAGFKTVGWHPFGGLPQPRDRKDLHIIGLSAEHTKIEHIHQKKVNLKRNQKLTLVPGYTDAAGMLHGMIYAIRNDIVVAVWETV